jgi:pimeloyl-ACP methyl ester carboxylesterase
VLLLAGEYDVGLPPRNAAECAGLFEHAELAVQSGAGHFPWQHGVEGIGIMDAGTAPDTST